MVLKTLAMVLSDIAVDLSVVYVPMHADPERDTCIWDASVKVIEFLFHVHVRNISLAAKESRNATRGCWQSMIAQIFPHPRISNQLNSRVVALCVMMSP